MSFLGKSKRFAVPPLFDPREFDKRDRFGLPILRLSLLSESPGERQARRKLIEGLIADLARAAVTHLDSDEAMRLFQTAVKPRRSKGRQPNYDRNRQLLEMYDRELGKTPAKIKEIPRRLAKKQHPMDPSQADSLERHIRRLVKERRQTQAAMQEAYPPTLLERFGADK